jgi:hypothetical protein
MLRRFSIAAAGALTVATFAVLSMQAFSPADAQERAGGAVAACERQDRQGVGSLRAKDSQQQAFPSFKGGVRVASGDVDSGGDADLRVRAGAEPASRSKDSKHRDEIHIESFSWGASQSQGAGCPPAARAVQPR